MTGAVESRARSNGPEGKGTGEPKKGIMRYPAPGGSRSSCNATTSLRRRALSSVREEKTEVSE